MEISSFNPQAFIKIQQHSSPQEDNSSPGFWQMILDPCSLVGRVCQNWRDIFLIAMTALQVIFFVSALLQGSLLFMILALLNAGTFVMVMNELHEAADLRSAINDVTDASNDLKLTNKDLRSTALVHAQENKIHSENNTALTIKIGTLEKVTQDIGDKLLTIAGAIGTDQEQAKNLVDKLIKGVQTELNEAQKLADAIAKEIGPQAEQILKTLEQVKTGAAATHQIYQQVTVANETLNITNQRLLEATTALTKTLTQNDEEQKKLTLLRTSLVNEIENLVEQKSKLIEDMQSNNRKISESTGKLNSAVNGATLALASPMRTGQKPQISDKVMNYWV